VAKPVQRCDYEADVGMISDHGSALAEHLRWPKFAEKKYLVERYRMYLNKI
jgi:hypothetical protein